MVGATVGRGVEDAEHGEAVDDGGDQPLREGGGEEGVVFGEGGGVGLETSVGEGDPALRGNLL